MKFWKWLKRLVVDKEATEKQKEADMKKYILWVTTKHKDGYSSRWHGWSRDLLLTYDEALKEKAKIQHRFYDVEIVEV